MYKIAKTTNDTTETGSWACSLQNFLVIVKHGRVGGTTTSNPANFLGVRTTFLQISLQILRSGSDMTSYISEKKCDPNCVPFHFIFVTHKLT